MTDKAQTIYEQNCEDFRSLNEIMWRLPVIVMTLTGGLWFGLATLNFSTAARIGLLLLAAGANVGFIVALYRLRFIIGKLLDSIHAYQETPKGSGYIVVSVFAVMMGATAVGSVFAACNFETFFEDVPVEDDSRVDP